jgi:hypothetical protein
MDKLITITSLCLRISLIMLSTPTLNKINERLIFFQDIEYVLKNIKRIFKMKGSLYDKS